MLRLRGIFIATAPAAVIAGMNRQTLCTKASTPSAITPTRSAMPTVATMAKLRFRLRLHIAFSRASRADAQATNAAGASNGTTVPDATHTFGPYVPAAVVNPLTNSSTVVAIGTAAATTTGWYYNAVTGECHGANATGASSDDGN